MYLSCVYNVPLQKNASEEKNGLSLRISDPDSREALLVKDVKVLQVFRAVAWVLLVLYPLV